MQFSAEGEAVKLRCFCPAGSEQMLCKHLLAIFSGETEILYDRMQLEVFGELVGLLERAGAVEYHRIMMAELAEIDHEFKRVKRKFDVKRRELKDELCSGLRDGRRFST